MPATKEQACQILDEFIKKHLHDIAQRLKTQLAIDRQMSDSRERRISNPLPALSINSVCVQVESQVQFRPAEGIYSERISDPEIRYSLRIPDTDLWKSGHVTTGRGLLDTVSRKIAELPDDAKYRDGVAETKRRQIVELTGLQDRAFTHADELEQQRRRLVEVKAELEKSSNAASAGSVDNIVVD